MQRVSTFLSIYNIGGDRLRCTVIKILKDDDLRLAIEHLFIQIIRLFYH